MFAQVGEFASSKSAMNMRAPELSALITIFRSVGPGDLDPPVAQVGRRHGLDRPVALAELARLGQEGRELARVEPLLPLGARVEQLAAARAEAPLQLVHEGDRLFGQNFLHGR